MMPAQSPDSLLGILGVLVEDKLLTKSQADGVRDEFVKRGVAVDEYLIERKLISKQDWVEAKAKYFKIPYVNLSDQASSPVAMGYVDQAVATRFLLVPFNYLSATNELEVAMANPLDLPAIEFIEKKAGVKVKVYAADPEQVQEAVELRYQQSLSTEVTAALKEAGGTGNTEIKTVNVRKVNELIREVPIAKIVTTILEFAAKSRASDVHIEPLEGRTRVRYRIDGILHEKLVLPRKIHDALTSRIKILSDLKIDERRIPQDGRFNFQTDTEEIDLRVSTLPTVFGEKVVMRLLKKTGVVPTLQDLGLRGRALKNLEENILRPHGIILVTGPTGSGKTTTLYSILSRINTTKVNVVTLEDPVEYQIGGVNQVQINPQAGLTFASGLRSFLRQDPNIIMVGEIRDQETAELAVQASLTGHLVFSTLHTNSASGALPRLLDMHAEPYLLASTITAIVGQRVVRKICSSCRISYVPVATVVDDIKKILDKMWALDEKKVEFFRGNGCEECGGTGYKGRVGIFEVLPVSEKVGRMLLDRSPASEIERIAVEEGMITMKQDGYMKVVEGVTTIEEVLRVAQE